VSAPLTPEEAIDKLARHLFWTEARFLPEGEDWETLTETDHDLYRALIRELFEGASYC
jgi:hypothetical protein